MSAACSGGRRDGMNPQLIGYPLQTLNIYIVHEWCKLYAGKVKKKVELRAGRLARRNGEESFCPVQRRKRGFEGRVFQPASSHNCILLKVLNTCEGYGFKRVAD